MDTKMVSIGARIKAKRKELGLTQTDIFQQCGITSGALSYIENGTRTPSVLIFYKLSQVLKCDMEWLITGISVDKQNFVFSEKENKLLERFRQLSEREQDEVQELIEFKIYKAEKEKTYTKSSHLAGIDNDSMVG